MPGTPSLSVGMQGRGKGKIEAETVYKDNLSWTTPLLQVSHLAIQQTLSTFHMLVKFCEWYKQE